MEIKNVAIIKGMSQYGVLDYFGEELAKGFNMCGINVQIILIDEIYDVTINKKLSDVDLIISFNSMTFCMLEFQSVFNRYGIPCWAFMVDHPYYHNLRLKNTTYYQIFSVVDREHLKYIKKYYPNIKYSFYVPHGCAVSEHTAVDFESRSYDLSFFGSYQRGDAILERIGKYSRKMQELLIKAVDMVWSGVEISLDRSIVKVFKDYHLIENEDKICYLMQEFNFLDEYIRNERRALLIETALKTGREVHVFGNGWENYQCDNDKLVIHGSVDYDKSLELMSDSRIVLNNMPLFTDGSHERIYSIMSSGAICLTDANPYLMENFENEKEIFYYDWNNMEKLPDIIERILNGYYDAEIIINSGREKAQLEHTWFNRAKEILSYAQQLDYKIKRKNYSNPIDQDMFSLLNYIENTDSVLLYEQIKGRFNWYEQYYDEYVNLFFCYMNQYRFWGSWDPENDDYGIIKERVQILKDHGNNFKLLFNRLGDYDSKKVLCNILLNWVTFSYDYLKNIMSDNSNHYFAHDIINISVDEVFVDIGAGVGHTVEKFVKETNGNFKKIYCYEFNAGNIEKLGAIEETNDHIVVRPYAIGDKEGNVIIKMNEDVLSYRSKDDETTNDLIEVRMVSLDEDVEEKVTFIKSDIAGVERKALEGAKNHIINDHPKLAISVYHGNYDIYRVAEYISNLDDSYQFYMRYYGEGIYPNEIVLYAV